MRVGFPVLSHRLPVFHDNCQSNCYLLGYSSDKKTPCLDP